MTKHAHMNVEKTMRDYAAGFEELMSKMDNRPTADRAYVAALRLCKPVYLSVARACLEGFNAGVPDDVLHSALATAIWNGYPVGLPDDFMWSISEELRRRKTLLHEASTVFIENTEVKGGNA